MTNPKRNPIFHQESPKDELIAIYQSLWGTLSNLEEGIPEGSKVPQHVMKRIFRDLEFIKELGQYLPEEWPK